MYKTYSLLFHPKLDVYRLQQSAYEIRLFKYALKSLYRRKGYAAQKNDALMQELNLCMAFPSWNSFHFMFVYNRKLVNFHWSMSLEFPFT